MFSLVKNKRKHAPINRRWAISHAKDSIDAKVMDIDKNILTNIEVDIDSDIDGSVVILGDNNNEAWFETPEVKHDTQEKKEEKTKGVEVRTLTKRNYENIKTNKIHVLKCNILEEELEFKTKLHAEELKIKILEREHKENLFKLELQIKLKELEKMEN